MEFGWFSFKAIARLKATESDFCRDIDKNCKSWIQAFSCPARDTCNFTWVEYATCALVCSR